jgi:prolipoprotein diacylglyceryltransferase
VTVLGRYCVLAGLTRFGTEFIRVNDRVLGSLTIARLLSVAAIITDILTIG